MARTPRLSAVVVHWRDEENLQGLLAAWPRDESLELLVVDNSRSLADLAEPVRRITPDRNLGFAGGANRGIAEARGPIVLILNADARPEPGALEAMLGAFDEYPEAAGIVPALVGADGESQHRWQLQPLPSPSDLLLQTLGLAGRRGPHRTPARGTAVEQPAAAALALRRSAIRQVGGFDEGFFPAWFEDVDLARRLAQSGHRLLYEPLAVFEHAGGASVPTLGYGPFLWIYYRGLDRYLGLHHATIWRWLARLSLVAGTLARLALLPVRRPRRAVDRRSAATGLLAVMAGAVTGWRRPARLVQRFMPKGDE